MSREDADDYDFDATTRAPRRAAPSGALHRQLFVVAEADVLPFISERAAIIAREDGFSEALSCRFEPTEGFSGLGLRSSPGVTVAENKVELGVAAGRARNHKLVNRFLRIMQV